MRRVLLPLTILAAGCSGGSKGGSDGRVNVQLLLPATGSPDPLTGVDHFTVSVLNGGTVVTSQDFGATEALVIHGLTEGTGRTVRLEAFDAGNGRLAHGQTTAFDFVKGSTVDESLYFATDDSFNRVHGTAAARSGASSALLPDGRVLIAGGLSSGAAVKTTAIYDPVTDTVAAGPDMKAAHAFAVTLALDANTTLVAGGTSDGTAAIGDTDVFVYQASSHSGSWTAGLTAMASPRHDACGAALGADRAVVGGGNDGATNFDTLEVFSWTGVTGFWSAVPTAMAHPRHGCIALGIGTDLAVVGAGDDGATSQKDAQLYTWDAGGGALTNAGQFQDSVSLPGVVKIGTAKWLVFGGQTNANDTKNTSIVTISGGNNVSASPADALPSAQRRGGGGLLSSGTALLTGGDTGTGATVTPADRSVLYDISGNSMSATGAAATPGPSVTGDAFALPDGTAIVITDAGPFRYNP
jgi:hypothetical protein